MGCDIHLYVERRENDQWISCDQWEQDKYDPSLTTVVYDARFYKDRNYDLFAILADVRNGYGFAGVPTGRGLNPISKPKGLPEDVSDLIRGDSESWAGDGHSHSWHTVADLLAYDWTQVTTKMGVINAVEYLEWSRWRKGQGLGPESYSGGVCGSNIRHISSEDMDWLCKEWRVRLDSLRGADKDWTYAFEQFKEMNSNIYTTVEWTAPYYRQASTFLSETLPKLWRLGKPEDVRIVFWFDN